MKILVLDIGTYSVNAVLAEKVGKKLSVLKTKEIIHHINFSWDEFEKIEKIAVLEEFLKDKSFEADFVLVNIDNLFLDTRFIVLPFRDNKRIAMSLPIELEDHVPFDMDKYFLDWHLVGGANKLYKIFVVLLEKINLEKYLKILQKTGLDPDVISSDFDPFINLVIDGDLYEHMLKSKNQKIKFETEIIEKNDKKNEIKKENIDTKKENTRISSEDNESEESTIEKETKIENTLIVNIGANKTDIIVFKEKIIIDAASIPYAGNYITKTISKDYKIKLEDAENKKKTAKIILENTSQETQENIDLSEIILSALDIIVREINQILAAFKAKNKEFVDNLILFGNGAKIDNLKEYLAKELNLSIIDVKVCDILKDKGIDIKKDICADSHIPALSYLIQFINHRTWRGINFRKGLYSKEYKGEGFYKSMNLFKPIVKLLAIISVSFFIYYFIYSAILNNTIEKQTKSVTTLTKQVFSEKGSRSISVLLEDLDRLLFKVINKKKLYNKSDKMSLGTILDTLNFVSASVNKKDKIEIKELVLSTGSLKITNAKSDTAEAIQRFTEALQQVTLFKEVNVGSIKISADGVSKSFTLTAKFKKGKK